jgi:hypothetical protein
MRRRVPITTSWRATAAVLVLSVVVAACSSQSSSIQPTSSTGAAIGQPSPYLSANLSAVSCGSSGLCAAVGSPFDPSSTTPILATSSTMGQAWKRADLPLQATITGAGCSATSCLAIGFAGLRPVVLSSTKSLQWAVATSLPQALTPQAVACASTKWCAVIGANQSAVAEVTTLNGGKTWSAPVVLPVGIGKVLSLACTSASTCITTGIDPNGHGQVLLTSPSQSGWQLATLPSGANAVLAASCRIDQVCWIVTKSAVTSPGQLAATAAGSTTFAPMPSFSQVANPTAVSCAATTCVIGGSSTSQTGTLVSKTATNQPRSFSTKYLPTGIVAVSCPLATSCVGATTSSLVQIAPSVPQRSRKQAG